MAAAWLGADKRVVRARAAVHTVEGIVYYTSGAHAHLGSMVSLARTARLPASLPVACSHYHYCSTRGSMIERGPRQSYGILVAIQKARRLV